MTEQFWWFTGLAAILLIAEGLIVWVFLRAAWETQNAISRLRHSLADASASNAEVRAAYSRLLLHREGLERVS